MKNLLKKEISNSIKVTKSLIYLEGEIEKVINIIVRKLKLGGKILICGNGGSAADAQHLTAEFLVRLRPKKNRKPIPAINLLMDSSTITACSNDYNFSKVFSRNFEALAKKNDVLLIFSTSGKSKNIIEVLKMSKKHKISTVGFLGNGGSKAKKFCDYKLIVKSNDTAKIQECHKFLSHFIAMCIEDSLF